MIVWPFSTHHIEERLNADYTLSFNLIERFSDLLRLKLLLSHVMLQLNGHDQFPTT